MNDRLFVTLVAVSVSVLVQACSSTPKQTEPKTLSNTTATSGGIVISDEMIGRPRGVMHLSQVSKDPAYGYTEGLPVMVGGGFGTGSDRTYKYLNTLRGPNGQPIKYNRVGTCCSFKTPNSPFGDGQGLLEVYQITVPGTESPKRLYFNWYDEGAVLVPVGLSAAP